MGCKRWIGCSFKIVSSGVHRAEWNFIGLNWHDSGFMFQVVRLVSQVFLSTLQQHLKAPVLDVIWCLRWKSFSTMPESGSVGHMRTCLRCVAMLCQMGRFPHTELTLTTGLSVLNTNVPGSFSFVRHVPGFKTLLQFLFAPANLFYFILFQFLCLFQRSFFIELFGPMDPNV